MFFVAVQIVANGTLRCSLRCKSVIAIGCIADNKGVGFRADNHPIHYDIEFCRAHGHRNVLAHGFQVLAFSAVGAGTFPHMIGDKLIGFIEQSSKFLKPVYVGDTLYATLTITALSRQRTTGVVVMAATIHNQKSELVQTGEHKYLLRI